MTHVQARVASIEAHTLRLSNGLPLAFDICVVATGRAYEFPFRCGPDTDEEESTWSLVNQVRLLADARAQLAQAARVVVVGGGPTGVETAAEIKNAHPLKQVALVHNKARLLNKEKNVSWHDSSIVLQKLQVLGVDVELSSSFQPGGTDPRTFVVLATGRRPNTDLFAENDLDDDRLVKTDQFLRVLGRENVFALGDIVSGYAANLKTVHLHAKTAFHNVWRLCRGRTVKRVVGRVPALLDSYFVVTLGPKESYAHGVAGMLAAPQKRKDFLIRAELKQLMGPAMAAARRE